MKTSLGTAGSLLAPDPKQIAPGYSKRPTQTFLFFRSQLGSHCDRNPSPLSKQASKPPTSLQIPSTELSSLLPSPALPPGVPGSTSQENKHLQEVKFSLVPESLP